MEQFLAYVAVENVAYHFDILYGYTYDEALKDKIKPGVRVQIPFGKSKSKPRRGIVFSLGKPEDKIRYKSILSVLDSTVIFSKEMLQIAVFLKERTFCTYYDGARVQLPTGFNFKTLVTYIAVPYEEKERLNNDEKALYEYMLEKCVSLDIDTVKKATKLSDVDKVMESLVSLGAVLKNYEVKSKIGDATVKTAEIAVSEDEIEDIFSSLTEKQKSVISFLKEVSCATVKEICYYTGVTAAVVTVLSQKGIISISDKRFFRVPKTYALSNDKSGEISLTEKQEKAYKGLLTDYKKGAGVSLLYGITGSGKTSVFIKLIDDVIADGREVIVMVPEISLTPQMIAIFKSRYGSAVAVFHSALSMGERKDEYNRVKEGKVKIAIGTRSAVFAPFENLGLIVMDEEQEHTYKSESSPRYHARDVAKMRAVYHNALLLLASATPGVETYSLAQKGVYSFHKLDERFGNAVLPEVSVVDLINDRQRGNKYSISLEMQRLIDDNLKNKKQTILLMNRRGYNTYAACEKCGEIKCCPSCNISLTFHRDNNRLMCHYCGYSEPFTVKCFSCGKERVRYEGYGTQRVEEEIEKLFPNARLLRLDADSSVSREKFEQSLNDFSKGEYDIMLGTQMVAKGLDFENVTLVGVINADSQLKSDDFRSAELTFDLLTQVVGRSGRGSQKGVALIQTTAPENNIINLAKKQDYEAFYKDEIKIRKALIYPPYCDLCDVVFSGENEHHTFMAAKCFYDRIIALVESEYKGMRLIAFSPVCPKINKMNNKYRYRILLKAKNTKAFRSLISNLLIEFGKSKTFSDVGLYADMNPLNLI